MGILVSVAALVISIFSLTLSFLQSYDKAFNIHDIKINPLNDSFDLLFNNQNKFYVDVANYNNRDILIYLYDGYIDITGKKHKLKPMHYTVKANAITSIEIEILVESHQIKRKNYDILLAFKYKGLLFGRVYKHRGRVA